MYFSNQYKPQAEEFPEDFATFILVVIIKSSTERATASNEAPITTGCIIGIVIVKKAFKGEAPRSLALSITL